MSDRRTFLKSTVAVAAGLALGATNVSAETGPFPSGVVYTAEDPGMWDKKVGSHAPQVSVDGDKLTIETKHPMSADHYIVRHTLVSSDGKVVGYQVFSPDGTPKSTYATPAKGEYFATSFCNLHDFWVTKVTI